MEGGFSVGVSCYCYCYCYWLPISPPLPLAHLTPRQQVKGHDQHEHHKRRIRVIRSAKERSNQEKNRARNEEKRADDPHALALPVAEVEDVEAGHDAEAEEEAVVADVVVVDGELHAVPSPAGKVRGGSER